MRELVVAVLLAALVSVNNGEPFKKYDAAAVRRFDDELRRMGIVLPSLSKPDEPIDLPPPIVSSSAGDFEGYWSKTQFGRPLAAFEGIPYAQPPIGKLRFRVAQPLAERLENFQAKKPGSMCYQRNIFMHSTLIEGQEDCLFINVYTPDRVNRSKIELLPVMFWIHGGGFLSGEGALYQPHILLDQDVVLVTMNYRLGPLGFLTTEDGIIPGNLGLKDQVEALRWVHSNIPAFGGDPNLVTIFGQSAGGASTEYHMLSPQSRGLFHRAISISGQTLAPWAVAPRGETARSRNTAAKHWGCPVKPSTALLECLNTKTGEEITGVDYTFIKWGVSPLMPFKPVVEGQVSGAFLPYHPYIHFADGNFHDVPYMSGMTSEEGGLGAIDIFINETQLEEFNKDFKSLLPLILLMDEQVSENTKIAIAEAYRRAYFPPGPITKEDVSGGINVFTDFFMLYPLIKNVRARSQHAKSATYTWLFSYEGRRSFSKVFGDPVNSYGVCHGDDLLYLFNLPLIFGNEQLTPQDVWMSIFLTEIYTNFAKNGVPSSKLTKTVWKPTTGHDEKLEYLNIGGPGKIAMETNMLPERWRFIEEITNMIEKDQVKDEL